MKLSGSCHCKATRFEVEAEPESVTACTCSNCSKRGALWAYYKPDQVRLLSDDAKGTYQWGWNVGKYNFCTVCGNSTYNETPAWREDGTPDLDNQQVSVNARLFDDFDLAGVRVDTIDGKNLW